MQSNVTSLQAVQNFRTPDLPDFVGLRVEKFFRDRVEKSWGGRHILRGRLPGSDAIHLSSNDYLSISNHPKILTAMAESIQREGNGLLMSAIFLQGASLQLALEERLARFMRAEAGVICQSGYAANTGLIQAIASEHTPVYLDKMAHMSLWEGVTCAAAKAIPVLHNDLESMEREILRGGPGIVVVDSVYSTNGSVAPLTEIAELCEAHGCVLVVDESHSLGTHGPAGAGMVVELGLESKVHFRTASLAKAFAGRAGFITCSKRFADYFKFESRPAIFSSTLLPHEVRGMDATLSVIKQEEWRRERLHACAAYLRREIDALGYELSDSQSQIIALESGTEQQTIVLRDALESRGIFGSIFCAPATPRNRAIVRFSINAGLSDSDVERIVQACRDMRDEVDMVNWPSSRRKYERVTGGSANMATNPAVAAA